MIDIPHQLRNACEAVRRKDYPLADLIPTMQQAADLIDSLRGQLNEQGAILTQYRAEMGEVTKIALRSGKWPFPQGSRHA